MDGISAYSYFLRAHLPQLMLSNVPEHFWETLSKKITDNIFDCGLTFQLLELDYEDSDFMPYDPFWSVVPICDIKRSDPNHIYLIDHAWTFKANRIKNNLRSIPALLDRMCALMKVVSGSIEEKIDKVSRGLWRYAHTYAVIGDQFSPEQRVPVWYVLDELGCGITHSDNPNFRTVPFIYVPTQVTYTIIFPIRDVKEGDAITRNFVEGNYPHYRQRDAMLIPWKHYDYFDEDFTQQEPESDYFLEGHVYEDLPDLEILDIRQNIPNRLKVFSQYSFINDHLTSPHFEIVYNENQADIMWYTEHYKTFNDLSINSPNTFINQFPYEYIITVKDLLPIVARRCSSDCKNPNDPFESNPAWLPITFNLKTELCKLVSYYVQRKKAGLDNLWICKPYNLARSLDTYITDDLQFMCRLPASGPKIAQKYIEDPVLFDRPDVGLVKFDIRYVILLKGVNPTEVYIYNNFFLRFSNKPFGLDNLEDFEQHFTVMNYLDGVPLYRVLCDEFKEAWARQYANYNWSEVEKSITEMFSQLFIAATSKEPPCGIAKSPQSRALYAADLMLSWNKKNGDTTIQPKLLEINWMPDCQRACEYYPDFYNDIFSVLFLNRDVGSCTKIL
ncbi:tubulin--tyrosine ligase-like protein 12 [Achroia grisella]|uniref:tubulin--tyrosine ligase-like protein 12 n=1 Tax=Achroia grisella TaxID=688607 RepID=UPI0027D1FC4C|nr:tubulin--tyrosine ligase-like protein 12 [Achroia grisella]